MAKASAQVWAERVAEWRASGQSADAFAVERGFTSATLRWWATRLSRESRERQKTTQVRVARVVRETAPRASAPGMVIEIHGARVLVPTGADTATLKTVLAALGGAS